MPKIAARQVLPLRRETAPLVIQDNELIVGAPCAPRAGAFSPDIAWRWMIIDTIGTRPQDPSTFPRTTSASCAKSVSFW